MARLFPDDSDSAESTRLPDLDCFDCEAGNDVVSEGHVDPVTMSDTTYLYKSPLSALTISIEHRPKKGLSFQIWPSSLSLAKYAELQHNMRPRSWRGVRVLELGCGCGLVGLCFAACGADVLLTDLPKTMDIIRENITLNSPTIRAAGGSAAAAPLVWGVTRAAELEGGWHAPDMVVAADVVYRRELFQPLLHALAGLTEVRPAYIGSADRRILLAHVRRWKSDKAFFQAARKMFHVQDISSAIEPLADARMSHARGALRLFELRRKGAGPAT